MIRYCKVIIIFSQRRFACLSIVLCGSQSYVYMYTEIRELMANSH